MTSITFYMVTVWTLIFFASVNIVTASPYECNVPGRPVLSTEHRRENRPLRRNFNFTLPQLTRRQFSPVDDNVPEECLELGYCEDAPNYPTDVVNELIAQMGDAVNNLPKEELSDKDITADTRRKGSLPDYELCGIRTSIIYPNMGRDHKDKWWYIINRNKEPIQGFQVEICDYTQGHACSSKISFQEGYKAECEQRFSYRTALVLGPENKMITKQMLLPTCCSCVAKEDAHWES